MFIMDFSINFPGFKVDFHHVVHVTWKLLLICHLPVLTDFLCCPAPWINSPPFYMIWGGLEGRIIKENCASYWSLPIAPTRLGNIGEQNRSKYVNHYNSSFSYFLFPPPWRKLKIFSNLEKSFFETEEGVGWYESILALVPLKSEASQILTWRRIIKSRIWVATSKGRDPLDQFRLLFAPKILNLHVQNCLTSR